MSLPLVLQLCFVLSSFVLTTLFTAKAVSRVEVHIGGYEKTQIRKMFQSFRTQEGKGYSGLVSFDDEVKSQTIDRFNNSVEIYFSEEIEFRTFPYRHADSGDVEAGGKMHAKTQKGIGYHVIGIRKNHSIESVTEGEGFIHVAVALDGKIGWVQVPKGPHFSEVVQLGGKANDDSPKKDGIKKLIELNRDRYEKHFSDLTDLEEVLREDVYSNPAIKNLRTGRIAVPTPRPERLEDIPADRIPIPSRSPGKKDKAVRSEIGSKTESEAIDPKAQVCTDEFYKKDKKKGRCKPSRKCNVKVVPRSDPRRMRYHDELAYCAEKYDISYGHLKATLHAETSFRRLAENKPEKIAYLAGEVKNGYLKLYKWGKGLAQFGAINAHNHGLAWYESKDEIKELHPGKFEGLTNSEFKKARIKAKIFLPGDSYKGRKLASIYNKKAAICAKASLLSNEVRHQCFGDSLDGAGPCENKRIGSIAYTRGAGRKCNSAKSYKAKHGRAARSVVELISVEPKKGIRKSRVLKYQPMSHCYIYKIADLCGPTGGYIKSYESDENIPVTIDYKKSSNGESN